MHYNVDNNVLKSKLTINSIYIHSLRSIYLSIYISIYLSVYLSICLSVCLSVIVKHHCNSVKSIDLTNFTKIGRYSLASVSFVVGQLPPVIFICFIISFLWLRNLLHRNIKWSVVSSSSSSFCACVALCPYNCTYPPSKEACKQR